MAGITHLSQIYHEKGKEFINKLFDKYVTINEKLDFNSFQVEKTSENKFEFFKRNSDKPISTIDRILMKLYEEPIAYFEGLDESIKNKMPIGWRFGMEYTPNKQPHEIAYDKMPKNGLILSYIHVKNSHGKLLRTIQHKKELDKWADLLNISKAPIIFQGILSEDQKIKILDFIGTPFRELVTKFKTESFIKYVSTVLNPKLKHGTLDNDSTKNIEGVVFRFGDEDDKDVTLAKMVDPVFELMAKSRSDEKKDDEPNDIFQLTVLNIMNFIDNYNFKKFKIKGKDQDSRYISFVCQVFNAFIEKYKDDYKGLNFKEPSYMNSKTFDINKQFITNEETISLLEDKSNEKIFKIFLASFRKKKKKVNGIFTKEVIQQFNSTIEKIQSYISQGLLENEEIPTFSEYRMINGTDDEDEDDGQDIEEFRSFGSKVLNDQKEGEEKKEDEPKKKENNLEKGKKKVNIIVGRFQPLHNGHLAMIKDLNEMNKLPVVLVIVYPGHTSEKSPFTESTTKTIMSNLNKDTEGMIKDFCFIGKGFLNDVINKLRDLNYEPVLWGAGEDRINSYKKQIEFNFKKKNELKLRSDFKLVQMDRYGSGTEVRKNIKEDNFGKFKELVPKSVQGSYPLLRNDMERTSKEIEEREAEKAVL